MKNLFKTTVFLVTLFLTACNNFSSNKAADEKEKELLKKELELTKMELELKNQKLHKMTNEKETSATFNIHDDPLKVVQAIFDAAKSNDMTQLVGLCDPTGSGDGDTKSICKVSSQPKQAQDEFKRYFKNGRILGDAVINANRAKVKIKFGPEGETDEEINLTKVDGKWYLSSF